MTTELYYLTLTSAFIALLWMPYLANAMLVRGAATVLGDAPRESDKPLSPWARRLRAAHSNAIENHVVFAALVLVAHVAQISSAATVGAAIVYFWARVAHYLIYGLGITALRTLAFLVAWIAQMVFVWQLLMAVTK